MQHMRIFSKHRFKSLEESKVTGPSSLEKKMSHFKAQVNSKDFQKHSSEPFPIKSILMYTDQDFHRRLDIK